jgi:hypothetical protein
VRVDWLVVDVDVPPVVKPYSAWAVKAIVFTVPPVAVALKPETKLSAVRLPLRTFMPLNDAPLTASVSCWPSEASEVLILPISAPGSVAWVSAVAIELMVVMTELI